MKKKIYIAGKISGEDKLKCTEKFLKVQKEIEAQGFEVLNPLEIVGTWETTWEDAMKKCITKMLTADAVLMLPDWQESKGAMIECSLATDVNIKVLLGTRNLTERLK